LWSLWLNISITRQSELLGLARSTLYYTPIVNQEKRAIREQIESIYEKIPIYGYLKVHMQLMKDGFNISANTVQKYRKQMGLKAILALKAPNTSLKGGQPIYPHKLKGVEIKRTNQVWSADITYIRIKQHPIV
jgi:putative transposase